ncbi:MAG: hypothetical protein JJV98_03475 [Desulfosarcina sp.]|nr:hypothetical protein [Desulfobacterales bacterium]
MKIRDYSILALVVLFGVLVQVLLVVASTKETPVRAAEEFTRAFFKLDPAMTERMCEDLTADEDAVDNLIYNVAARARALGFSPGYMRMQLFYVETSVVAQDNQTARVHLRSEMKRSIHPAFAYFAKMWNLGETYHLDETLDLVKEGDLWKVCRHDLITIM